MQLCSSNSPILSNGLRSCRLNKHRGLAPRWHIIQVWSVLFLSHQAGSSNWTVYRRRDNQFACEFLFPFTRTNWTCWDNSQTLFFRLVSLSECLIDLCLRKVCMHGNPAEICTQTLTFAIIHKECLHHPGTSFGTQIAAMYSQMYSLHQSRPSLECFTQIVFHLTMKLSRSIKLLTR